MANFTESKHIGGEAFHVRDCYVWAEISYLDSPTDYREYLPQSCTWGSDVPACDRLVPDSPKRSSRSDECLSFGWKGSLIFFLLAGMLLYYSIVSL